MEFFKAILLGFIQGATEFLPVSSSGHLVIGSEILNFHEQGVVFDVFLHLGTLVSVFIAFRKEIGLMIQAPFAFMKKKMTPTLHQYLLWDVYVVIATLPAVFVGLFLKDHVEQAFQSVLVVYCMLAVTGLLMISAQFLKYRGTKLTGGNAFLIGCAQACAILPGLSRSGSTIFLGMLLGIDREKVARFSFIMSIPAILGAVVLQSGEFLENPPPRDAIVNLCAGTVMSAITGYFAIILLMGILKKNKLSWFGYYCLLVSCLGFLYYFFG